MDIFVATLLTEWELEELIPVFKENAIDEESLKLLDRDTLKDLIPQVGVRLKFQHRLKQLELNKQDEASQSSTSGSTIILASPDDESFTTTSTDGDETGPESGEKPVSASKSNLKWKMFGEASQSSTGGSTIILASPDDESSTTRSTDGDETGPESGEKPVSASKSNLKGKMFDVREILSNAGHDDIIKHIDENCLSTLERLKMVRILVSHLIEKHGLDVQTKVKIGLARAVVDDFPTLKDTEGEGYEAWYTKSIKSHPATGYLEERLRNVRKRSRNHPAKDEVPSKARKSSFGVKERPQLIRKQSTKVQSTGERYKKPESADNEELSKMVEWMKFNHAPAEKVKDYMRLTHPKRAEWLQSDKSQKSLCELLAQYPRLLDTPGMIEQDFLLQFSPVSLKEGWTDCLAVKLIAYATNHDPGWMNKLGSSEYGTDDILNLSVQVLPLILTPGAIVRNPGAKKIRAGVLDALSAFIDVKPVGTNIPDYLQEVSKDENRTQPFVIILGDRRHPSQAFAIIERVALPVCDLLDAVDLCFKSFFVLDINYPNQCSTSWEFVQRYIFQFGDGGKEMKSTSPSVRSLRTFLSQGTTS